jgi:hypothetical protein
MSESQTEISRLEQFSPTERYSQLREFEDQFEDLLDLVISAAQLGISAKIESKYDQLRAYMRDHYQIVKPFLSAYLQSSPEDSHFGLIHFQYPTDALETFWIADSLQQLVGLDDGEMIDKIMRSRSAIALYSEHLRYLVERSI